MCVHVGLRMSKWRGQTGRGKKGAFAPNDVPHESRRTSANICWSGVEADGLGMSAQGHFHLLDRYIRRIDALLPEASWDACVFGLALHPSLSVPPCTVIFLRALALSQSLAPVPSSSEFQLTNFEDMEDLVRPLSYKPNMEQTTRSREVESTAAECSLVCTGSKQFLAGRSRSPSPTKLSSLMASQSRMYATSCTPSCQNTWPWAGMEREARAVTPRKKNRGHGLKFYRRGGVCDVRD